MYIIIRKTKNVIEEETFPNESRDSNESDKIYEKHIDIIKFNYNDSVGRTTQLRLDLIKGKESPVRMYYKDKRGRWINMENIIGIVLGSRTTTFENVSDCNPWLCISIIKLTRTYDFQFNKYFELIWFLYHTRATYSHDITYKDSINIHKICLLHNKLESETYVRYYNRMIELIKLQSFDKIYKLTNVENFCPLCIETTTQNAKLLACKHIFCKNCITEYIKFTVIHEKKRISCPLCRKILS